MTDIFEVLRRAEEGVYIKEGDFDMKLFRTATRLMKERGINMDRNQIVVGDDDLADQVFEGGLRLALEMGLLCVSTSRVIQFTEEELRMAMKLAPQTMTVGMGRDARTLRARRLDDGYPMLVTGGCPGTPLPEELFLPVMMSYAREPIIDILAPGSLTSIEGLDVRTGGPLEVHACRQELTWTREALERAGRAGMHIFAAGESSATQLGSLAIANERYMRPSDSHMIPVLSELKTDYDRLTRVVTGHEYPAYMTSLVDPIIGGFGGGTEGVALVLAAAILLSTAAYGVHMHCIHPIHNRYISVSTLEGMWMDSVIGRAFARNAPMALLADAWTTAGAGTEEILYETAAMAIVQECSALNSDTLGATNGVYPHCSGLESRFYGEVVHAAFNQRLSTEQANDLVLKLFLKYQHGFENPNLGKPFTEVYDIKTITPKPDWLETYKRVKTNVASMGLQFTV